MRPTATTSQAAGVFWLLFFVIGFLISNPMGQKEIEIWREVRRACLFTSRLARSMRVPGPNARDLAKILPLVVA